MPSGGTKRMAQARLIYPTMVPSLDPPFQVTYEIANDSALPIREVQHLISPKPEEEGSLFPAGSVSSTTAAPPGTDTTFLLKHRILPGRAESVTITVLPVTQDGQVVDIPPARRPDNVSEIRVGGDRDAYISWTRHDRVLGRFRFGIQYTDEHGRRWARWYGLGQPERVLGYGYRTD
jgi:hypothetical protein